MIERIIISGFGGQGIMLMGKILAQAALKEGKFVTYMPSYGAEVRGGTAHCMIVISDSEIASPVVAKADTLIAMNDPSLLRFKDKLSRAALVIINSSMSEVGFIGKNILKGEFSGIASRLGNIKVANVVAIGAYIAKKKIVSKMSIVDVIKEIAPKDKRELIEINKKALDEGMRLV